MGYTITFHFANPKITKAIFEAIAPTNETSENPPLGFENVEPFNKIKFNLGKGPYSPNLKSDNSIISIHLTGIDDFRASLFFISWLADKIPEDYFKNKEKGFYYDTEFTFICSGYTKEEALSKINKEKEYGIENTVQYIDPEGFPCGINELPGPEENKIEKIKTAFFSFMDKKDEILKKNKDEIVDLIKKSPVNFIAIASDVSTKIIRKNYKNIINQNSCKIIESIQKIGKNNIKMKI